MNIVKTTSVYDLFSKAVVAKLDKEHKFQPHQCHYNAGMFAMATNCYFVTGYINYQAHCFNAVEKDGKLYYFDITAELVNQDTDGKVYVKTDMFTSNEIAKIFAKEHYAFNPSQGAFNDKYEYIIYNKNHARLVNDQQAAIERDMDTMTAARLVSDAKC